MPGSEPLDPVREAVALFKAGRLREAVRLLEGFVGEMPADAVAQWHLGIAYSSSGNHARALKAFRAATELDPGSAAIRYNMGVAQQKAGHLLKAAESFAEATRLDESFYEAWDVRAEILIKLGDRPGAREAAQTAARLRPEEESPWQLLTLAALLEDDFPAVGQALEGYRLCTGVLTHLFPRLQVLVGPKLAVERARVVLARRGILAREAALFLGEYHYWEQEPDTAIAYLLDARSLGAEDAGTLIWLSRAYAMRGRMDEAETAVRLATALEPQNTRAWAARGNVMSELGKYEEAVEAHRAATHAAPADGVAWYNLGLALSRTGRRDEAIKAYRQATRLGPESSRASNNLGAVFLELEREGDARRAFEEAIRYNPENGRAWGNLGLLLARQGDREEAIRHLRQALKLRPERADLSVALIELQAESPPTVE